MSGTVEGSRIATATIKAKYGQDFFARIGQIGGKKGTGHKFAHGKCDPREMGRIGGTISKRGKVNE